MAEKPIEYTNLIAKLEAGKDYLIFYDGDSGYTLGIVHYHKSFKDTIELIQAAVNACISINKENPMAVPEGMEDAVEVCKLFANLKADNKNSLTKMPSPISVKFAEQTLSRITGGK